MDPVTPPKPISNLPARLLSSGSDGSRSRLESQDSFYDYPEDASSPAPDLLATADLTPEEQARIIDRKMSWGVSVDSFEPDAPDDGEAASAPAVASGGGDGNAELVSSPLTADEISVTGHSPAPGAGVNDESKEMGERAGASSTAPSAEAEQASGLADIGGEQGDHSRPPRGCLRCAVQ